jgi:arylsulfatase A-like enzyme
MKTFAIAFALVTALLLAPLAAIAAKPNVVYLLADDLGWGDLSVNGGSIPTPRIDRLFREGVRLDNFMGWCVCSPTRAMLLTGRHPFRVGTGPEVGGELAKEETTTAEAFKTHGYRTGIFGLGTLSGSRLKNPKYVEPAISEKEPCGPGAAYDSASSRMVRCRRNPGHQ